MHKVVVIGAGIVGLTTAVKIQEQLGSSVSVTVISEEFSPNTTGDVSAGLWMPYIIQETPEEDINKWSSETFNHFHELWMNGKAKETGISLMPIIQISTDTDARKPFWAHIPFGLMELSEKQLKTFSRDMNVPISSGFSFVTYTCEPSKYLPWLQKFFVENGGVLKVGKVSCFGEVSDDFDVIVNCSGLQAQTLANDPLTKPVRGQIARVRAPWQTFALGTFQGNYIIPNINSVIFGGTAQIDNYNLNVDETDKSNILRNCYRLIPSLKNSEILSHQVGLRPGRNKVRLELEMKRIGNKDVKIVHNYGHGGSGVTLAIGCATDATLLVKSALQQFRHKL